VTHFDPEPRRPPPTLTDYALGAFVYAAVVVAGALRRLVRGR